MPRRSAADAARTRIEILRAARRLFADQGFAATTTNQIAEAAGVSVGALFHHFEGKTGLFRSVFESLELEMDGYVRETAGEFTGLDTFLTGFRAYLEFAKRRDFHRIVMLEGPVVRRDHGDGRAATPRDRGCPRRPAASSARPAAARSDERSRVHGCPRGVEEGSRRARGCDALPADAAPAR
jgi:AcrR family transcriptional regulator